MRLGRLIEMAGIASSFFRASAAAEKGSKRKSKGASGDGGATAATAAVVGTPPESLGARRVSWERVIRVCFAEDLRRQAAHSRQLALSGSARV